jgi:4'-phosphopantetheinyl transferase
VHLQFPATSAVRPGLSVSHEQGLSLAAIAPQGPVGVDLLAVTAVPDADECLRLARDYLGSHTAQALAALPATQRTMAFARAWTAQEARLKCMGLGLDEWSPENEATWPQLHQDPLTLPQGYLGSVAHLHTR